MEINVTKNSAKDIVNEDLRQDLANYIMSVQSLIDRIHIMERDKLSDFTHINKRINTLEKYEDIVLTKLGKVVE